MLFVILVNYPDNEFLSYVEKTYYSTKDIELKKLCCQYVLNLTNDVSHKIIYDSVNSKTPQLQLAVLTLAKDKINYKNMDIFLPLCNSKNIQVKQSAISTLQNLFAEKEKVYIIEFLKDNTIQIKLIGIQLMANIFPQEFLSYVPQLLSSKNEFVRKTTLEMLMQISGTKQNYHIKNLVFDIAKKDSSIEVRSTAIKTLSFIWRDCSPEAVNLYFESISSYDQKMQEAAKDAFNNILYIAPNLDEIVIRGLVHESISINKFFIEKIIELKPKSEKIKQILVNKILITTDETIQKLLRSSLAEILSQEDIGLIKNLYTNGNITTKIWCLEQLNKFPLSPELESFLLTTLKEPQTVIRLKAVEITVPFLSSKNIYEAILYISQNDPSYTVRSAATKVLSNTKKYSR